MQPSPERFITVDRSAPAHSGERNHRVDDLAGPADPFALASRSDAANSLPRALAWTSLLPRATYVAPQGPAWLQESLARVPQDARRKVLIRWQDKSGGLTDLQRFTAIVCIDCGGISDGELRRAGFACVRRLAVLPNPRDPRWFIPLGSRRVTAAAWTLAEPSRRTARLAHTAMKTALRLALPLGTSHTMIIASRDPSPLEKCFEEAFGLSAVHFALAAGNADTVRNRKFTLGIFDQRGASLGFAKLSATSVGARRLRQEASTLRKLEPLPQRSLAPRVVCDGEVQGLGFLATTPVSGRHPGPRMTAAHHRFLSAMQGSTSKRATQTALLKRLHLRAGRLASGELPLDGMLGRWWRLLETTVITATINHGDFAPWNLRRQNDGLVAFDWEYAELDGLPLFDECHHLMSVEYFLKGANVARASRQLRKMVASKRAGFTAQQVRALQAAYLIDHICRLLEEGYAPHYPKLDWWKRVLVAVGTSNESEVRPCA